MGKLFVVFKANAEVHCLYIAVNISIRGSFLLNYSKETDRLYRIARIDSSQIVTPGPRVFLSLLHNLCILFTTPKDQR